MKDNNKKASRKSIWIDEERKNESRVSREKEKRVYKQTKELIKQRRVSWRKKERKKDRKEKTKEQLHERRQENRKQRQNI